MKTIFNNVPGFLLAIILILSGCDKDFEKLNTDPINTANASPAQLLAPALVNTLTANMIRNRNFNNELMQVTVSQTDDDAAVFRYEYRNTQADYLWNAWYVQLTNLKDMHALSSNPAMVNTSYQAISLICQTWIYSMLTDAYGDIPYFKSNQARNDIIEPPFDKQKDIYLDMFQKLEEADMLLNINIPIEKSSDPVFDGDVTKWRKFGNSLYLRLLLRVSGKAEVSAQAISKIKEIIDTKPALYPIMASNDDSAILRWTGAGPYTSPYVNNVRAQDFRAPAIASFFIDHLRDWQDPRIDISNFGKNGVNRWGIAQGSNSFSGVPSGYLAGTGVSKQAYFYSYDQIVSSKPAQSLQNDPLTGMIMNYAELQFILAEAATKGWINGSAETFYNTGILNGITLWVPTFATSITDPAFVKYITEADITWVNAQTPAQKMEFIHLQKYYALFLTDLQQWFEYRRTNYPALPKGPGLRNGGIMPARLTYPVYVQSANPTNYDRAVASQGPDLISTQVWWQKP